ncbi:hypothetical protein HDV00_000429 [Rhizophlyctis rosea]|nr:hypothetical protein HDV00_000429 [Rhizophlyctis rosea]
MSNRLSVNDLPPTLIFDIFEYIQPRSAPLQKVPRDVLEREEHDSDGNAPQNRPYEVHLAQRVALQMQRPVVPLEEELEDAIERVRAIGVEHVIIREWE